MHTLSAVELRLVFVAMLTLLRFAALHAADPWVVYDGSEGPGKGKHIVLVSGDEEYRSEEALPQRVRQPRPDRQP